MFLNNTPLAYIAIWGKTKLDFAFELTNIIICPVCTESSMEKCLHT